MNNINNNENLFAESLYEDFKWLAGVSTTTPLVEVVEQILQMEIFEEVGQVSQSSVWGVCTAYLDFKKRTNRLSRFQHDYVRSRGGVIGMRDEGEGKLCAITIREYIESRDHGFLIFTEQGGDRINCNPIP